MRIKLLLLLAQALAWAWRRLKPSRKRELADISENSVRSAAEELVSVGYKAITIRCNVADEAEVAAMIEQTVSTFGRLDAAFNNAGVQSPAIETADASGEEFERVHAINLRTLY